MQESNSPLPFGTKVCVTQIASIESSQQLVELLESKIESRAVVHCRLCTQKGSDRCRGTAIVQFKSQHHASRAVQLGRSRQLVFQGSKLKVYPAKEEPKKREDELIHVSHAVVHVGCLVNRDILYTLWTCTADLIEVDNSSKRFRIIMCTASRTTYKLEWRFRDIHEFCQCTFTGGSVGQTLMMRVWYTPQIFELSASGTEYISEDYWQSSFHCYADPVWVRTTDFSPDASIGQSFVYCLEIPQGQHGVLDFFLLELSSHRRSLTISHGVSYSMPLLTVPILDSDNLNWLPFELIFLINSLVQQGYLSGPNLRSSFFRLLSPSREMSLKDVVHVLDKLKREQDTCFDPEKWFRLAKEKFLRQAQREKLASHYVDDGLMMVRRLYVTPSRVYCIGPEVDVSNRVTRHFKEWIDDFLRVTFVEEDVDTLSAMALTVPKMNGLQTEHTKVYDRIVSILNDGFIIGEKKFEFLAFSSSQLRESSAWMFSANGRVTAQLIRDWMGDFLEITNVAKCAARMGQSFSSSTKSLDVPIYEVDTKISDVCYGTYCFSDGIGKISASFATKIAKKCKLRNNGRVPSLYQIRYGGYKGVVAVDPTSHHKLSLRRSMRKFDSSQISLDILNWSRPLPSYLNREIITLLSTLGVPDSVFQRMQGEVVQQLDDMLVDSYVALDVIQSFCGGSSTHRVMVEMLLAGFHPASEPFLMRMLNTFRECQLMSLRRKTRIFVPKGRLLMGCLDETKTLNYGEVFISISRTVDTQRIIHDGLNAITVNGINNLPQTVCIVKGTVIVAKNPCLHPGDIRILTAVDVPALHHLVDCVAFPQKGHRPHPNECSGSDLDGDLYFVSWDRDLIPQWQHAPQDYEPAKAQVLDRAVTIQDITTYFADFMVNNTLGILCSAHVVLADKSRNKACHPDCLELARLCSIAVDFPKTGIPAVLPADLRPTEYPDFMEKNDKPKYESPNVLGKLFRAIVDNEREQKIGFFTKREARECYDEELLVDGFEHYLEEATALKSSYDERLLDLMYQYDVKSEAEMFIGNIISLSKWFRRRPGDVKERIIRAMGSLRKEARTWIRDSELDLDDNDDDDNFEASNEQLLKASAWYHVTYHHRYVSMDTDRKYGHLLSFPWVVYDKLAIIKKFRLGDRN